ncbi:hypothetical protein ACHAW5_004108 [Stephanodiscus triporus]|uniref:SCP domain-containing protein n=1 Tax=Stephanodiscus triporus TaxID=2934178 RepID=A0ABD3P1W7_9STRA
MMKSVVLLTTVAAVAASTLRGAIPDGVEEVGEQMEHYPPPNWDGMLTPSRRSLMESRLDGIDGDDDETTGEGGEVHDPYVGEDVVGRLIEDVENDTGLFDWEAVDDEKMENKSYDPPVGSVTLEGNDLLGDVHDRRAGAQSCQDDEGRVSIDLKTDLYGYETSWKVVDASSGASVAKGPPQGTKYADSKQYTGSWCLSPGTYRVVVTDNGNDGMCRSGTTGCGYFKVKLDGVSAGQVVQNKQAWGTKTFQVSVVPMSSRIDGASTSSSSSSSNNGADSGGWCDRVKSSVKLPSGTCSLPGGSTGHRVRVITKVDKFGEETSWRITSNGVVRMKMGAIVPANSARAVEDCLPAGDYNFQIFDQDGICCQHGNGEYRVIVDGQELFTGGAFFPSESRPFRLGHDWISGMSERDCEWWWAHDYRRQDWHTRCTDHYCDKSARHLRWSGALEADARDYAVRLLDTCDEKGIKHDHTDQGENLAKNVGESSTFGRLYPADNIVKRFVDNEEYWGWNDNAHLTQAMWYASRYVGCAESARDMGDGKTCRMQVCRYAKAGNCQMAKYSSESGNKWMVPMMMDDSPCGPVCPPQGGCVSLYYPPPPAYRYYSYARDVFLFYDATHIFLFPLFPQHM